MTRLNSSRHRGQAFYYGLMGVFLALAFFGATSPVMQNMIDGIAPGMSVTTQAFLGIILPGIVIAIIIGFWKTVSPSAA